MENQKELFTEQQAFQIGNNSKSAVISPCGKYRYQLRRIWDEEKPLVLFIMLNPSTADAENDDPTIRRCRSFAQNWGFGGFMVGNLYAFRSTDPRQILTCDDPIGPDNKKHIDKLTKRAELVICAWGNSKIVEKLCKRYGSDYLPLKGITNLRYLELAIDGTPKHPLYLKGDLLPQEFKTPVCSIV